jgi:UDP-N-acetylmuramate dehydrogenase
MRVGGIVIADFHGNLFINRNHGTAQDVRRLARILKARVRRKFGITLEEEIRYF